VLNTTGAAFRNYEFAVSKSEKVGRDNLRKRIENRMAELLASGIALDSGHEVRLRAAPFPF
jgi:hypothetical protein